jgi:hypothetical protein
MDSSKKTQKTSNILLKKILSQNRSMFTREVLVDLMLINEVNDMSNFFLGPSQHLLEKITYNV